jgi:peptide deformylase
VAVRPIRLYGDPVLHSPSEPVTTFDAELRTLITDMIETMIDAPGVGLAAPQVGVPLRVFVYDVEGVIGHLVNPTLTLSGELHEVEGCLSAPELRYARHRYGHAIAEGVDQYGEPLRLEGEGLLARCFQHETDHVNGMLYLENLSPEDKADALKRIDAGPPPWTN